jgi:hypothetical protein
MNISPIPVKATSSDKATAAANTAVVLTYAALTGFQHVIKWLVVSYSATPTGGNLTIEDGAGTTVFDSHIPTAGPHVVELGEGLMGSEGTALIVTLAAGGAGIVGKVNGLHTTY